MSVRPFFVRGLLALLLAFLAFLLPPLHCMAIAAAWPALPLPPDAQAVDVGQALRIDGLPIQARGFLSPAPLAQVLDWFRASLGSPLVTSRYKGKILLGQLRQGYYLTVQLEVAGNGTRGLVAQADLHTMMAGRTASVATDAHWQQRLPAGTRILSLVQARDGARQSQQVLLASRAPLADSGDALARMLAQDSYAPVRSIRGVSPPGLVLLFQGPGREAMAVLRNGVDGTTSIVLNTSVLDTGELGTGALTESTR